MANKKKELKRVKLPREQFRILMHAQSICNELQEKYSLIHGQRSDAIICATSHVIRGLEEIKKNIDKSPQAKYMEKIAEIDIYNDDK